MAFGLAASFVYWNCPMESELGSAIESLRLDQMK
jgi:hypothetical protein